MLINSQKHFETSIAVTGIEADGSISFRRLFSNTFTYKGVDVMAKALLSGGMMNLSYMYLYMSQRGNSGILPTYGVDLREVTRENFNIPESNFVNSTVWAPITSRASGSSGSKYTSNTVTYHSMFASVQTGDTNLSGKYFQPISEVRGISLAMAVDNDRNNDIIVSVVNIPEVKDVNNRQLYESFLIPGGSASMSIAYTITLL